MKIARSKGDEFVTDNGKLVEAKTASSDFRNSAGTNPVVTVAIFISTINLVLYRLPSFFCLIRSSHRPVAVRMDRSVDYPKVGHPKSRLTESQIPLKLYDLSALSDLALVHAYHLFIRIGCIVENQRKVHTVVREPAGFDSETRPTPEKPRNDTVFLEVVELLKESSGFEECDQENINEWLEYDADNPGYELLSDDILAQA
ncbi:hypothetical protein J6590_056035 [Homalodisca vitripennis]|nr:hypothetical protein J6590_056035 [Homalodisca vitripennis]